ncbi:hypothetical protein NHX12_017898 [Muraenolepis orangiensis]|uniref:Uncharacterized protein n=1 Tax=Muraenolepis orangiensis TaxID=630683 RepID=A0A9Q0EVQ7_9TELE|nr:hypothetical protein NHX12_017898 [Muraenolepis orangiensis]
MMRMMAMNGGMMNGGMMNGANPGMMGGGGLAPAMMGGGTPMVPRGEAGFAGQPFAQLQIGILASNSNEILRLNGLTLATLGQTQMQGSPMLPPYIFQQQPEVLFTPQMVNLNPQIGGPFGPQGPQFLFPTNQGNQQQLNLNGQQDQLGPLDPTVPLGPQQPQNPVQMIPQFQYPMYGYPQLPRMQGYPYYLSPYGYPQRNSMVLQPNQGQMNQQILDRTTKKPQLPLQQAFQPNVQVDKTRLAMTQRETFTSPPDNRGDAVGPGVDEGHSNIPFLFEP